MSTIAAMKGGFDDPAVDAAHGFRALLNAMAMPGTIHDVTGAVPVAPLSVAAGVAILTLCDPETPVYLAPSHDTDAVRDWITFHTGAPFVGPSHAAFAIGTWDALMPLDQFPIGTPEYPDRSTTLIVEMDALAQTGATLRGPGIRETAQLNLPGAGVMADNAALFPLGVDFILTAGAQVAALPRSTKIGER